MAAGAGGGGQSATRFVPTGGRPYDGAVSDPVQPVPLAVADDVLEGVRFDDRGLVPAIVQDDATGDVLMMAWMNAESLRLTFAEGRTVFWSRSRQELWRKGDTSGEVQLVRSAFYDCDADALLFRVDQLGGGACHTGNRSCFFRSFTDSADPPPS